MNDVFRGTRADCFKTKGLKRFEEDMEEKLGNPIKEVSETNQCIADWCEDIGIN